MGKIYRKDKIELLGKIYLNAINIGEDNARVWNKIIIDSIGVSGLEQVKQIAWKREGKLDAQDNTNEKKEYISQCCNAGIKKDQADEGTFTYVCVKCNKDCDAILKKFVKQNKEESK